jgi:type I restriction enzyme, S subunit
VKLPSYSKYKSSGVEWLGDVPKHWEVKRLKYSASINDEALPENTPPEFELRYIDIGNVESSEGIIAADQLTFDTAPSRARRIVRDGDTIVSTVRTYLRAIAPIRNPPGNLIVSTGFAVVRPRKIDSHFLSYALRESSFVETVVARSVGVSYPAVNASEVGTIPISIPPTNEQRAIADFLDRETTRLHTLVGRKRELIEKLKEKRTALISRTVTRGLNPTAKLKSSGIEWLGDIPEHWEVKPLFRITSAIQTGPFGSQLHEADYVSGGIPLINPAHIISGRLLPSEDSAVDSPTAARLGRHRLQRADIVMDRRGEIGRCGVVTEREIGWLCGTGSLVVRLVGSNANYYSTIISSAGFAGLLELNAVGTTMLNLNPSIVGRMRIPVPPLNEQNAIISYLDSETVKLRRSTR